MGEEVYRASLALNIGTEIRHRACGMKIDDHEGGVAKKLWHHMSAVGGCGTDGEVTRVAARLSRSDEYLGNIMQCIWQACPALLLLLTTHGAHVYCGDRPRVPTNYRSECFNERSFLALLQRVAEASDVLEACQDEACFSRPRAAPHHQTLQHMSRQDDGDVPSFAKFQKEKKAWFDQRVQSSFTSVCAISPVSLQPFLLGTLSSLTQLCKSSAVLVGQNRLRADRIKCEGWITGCRQGVSAAEVWRLFMLHVPYIAGVPVEREACQPLHEFLAVRWSSFCMLQEQDRCWWLRNVGGDRTYSKGLLMGVLALCWTWQWCARGGHSSPVAPYGDDG